MPDHSTQAILTSLNAGPTKTSRLGWRTSVGAAIAEIPQAPEPDLKTQIIDETIARIEATQVQAEVEAVLDNLKDDDGAIDFGEALAALEAAKNEITNT